MVRQSVLGVLALAGWGLLLGCTPNYPATVPVHGMVTLEGEPLRGGEIQFISDKALMATGRIQPDGTYRLSTFQPDDGAVPGTYRVVVKPPEVRTAFGTSALFYLPPRYADPETSGLKAVVNPGVTELNFALTLDQPEAP